MARDPKAWEKNVEVFDRRAANYDRGRLGVIHHYIAASTAALFLSSGATPGRVLDVGCGTGYVLRTLATDLKEATHLCGIDPSPSMIAKARQASVPDPRIHYSLGIGPTKSRVSGNALASSCRAVAWSWSISFPDRSSLRS